MLLKAESPGRIIPMSKLGSHWNRGRRILFRNGNRIRVKFRVSVDCNLSQLDRAFRSQRERAAAVQVELDASSQARLSSDLGPPCWQYTPP
ncbi:hypothetical protein QLX08_009371 [Tetragonisca angustula]|uniref:Uncharacterized protein n=1 Tax=Tetragonisca angustula TaxID=166442 RepID=A0AAW0ZH91_9HYME